MSSVPAASTAFSAHAHEYTALRRRLVPDLDGFYGTAVRILGELGATAPTMILDLGAGTGLLTVALATAYPDAAFELLDGSEAMLAEARERLGDRVAACHIRDMAAALPDGPYDAVASALAIHHLEHPDQRALYGEIHRVLRPGGVFVNAEQVAGATALLSALNERDWVAECLELGASREEIDAALERRLHDRCAAVPAHLDWLREAGFASVDCVYRSGERAVIVAIKGGS